VAVLCQSARSALYMRKCKHCGTKYEPVRQLQTGCGFDCDLALATKAAEKSRMNRERAAKKADREYKRETVRRKKALLDNDKPHWIKKAQTAFNAFIRERDRGLPCISCGVPDGKGKRNACHYRPAGVNTAIRFDELNVWGGCERCNTYKSGNIVGYRVGLIARIGIEAVDALDNNHDIKKWTIDELKAIQAHYKSKLKELKNV